MRTRSFDPEPLTSNTEPHTASQINIETSQSHSDKPIIIDSQGDITSESTQQPAASIEITTEQPMEASDLSISTSKTHDLHAPGTTDTVSGDHPTTTTANTTTIPDAEAEAKDKEEHNKDGTDGSNNEHITASGDLQSSQIRLGFVDRTVEEGTSSKLSLASLSYNDTCSALPAAAMSASAQVARQPADAMSPSDHYIARLKKENRDKDAAIAEWEQNAQNLQSKLDHCEETIVSYKIQLSKQRRDIDNTKAENEKLKDDYRWLDYDEEGNPIKGRKLLEQKYKRETSHRIQVESQNTELKQSVAELNTEAVMLKAELDKIKDLYIEAKTNEKILVNELAACKEHAATELAIAKTAGDESTGLLHKINSELERIFDGEHKPDTVDEWLELIHKSRSGGSKRRDSTTSLQSAHDGLKSSRKKQRDVSGASLGEELEETDFGNESEAEGGEGSEAEGEVEEAGVTLQGMEVGELAPEAGAADSTQAGTQSKAIEVPSQESPQTQTGEPVPEAGVADSAQAETQTAAVEATSEWTQTEEATLPPSAVPIWWWPVAFLFVLVCSVLALWLNSERQAWMNANIGGDRSAAILGPRGGVGEWGMGLGPAGGWGWMEGLLGIDRKMFG